MTSRWSCSKTDKSNCCSHETLFREATCGFKRRRAVNHALDSGVGSQTPACGVRGIGQVVKLLGARADVRLTRRFWDGESSTKTVRTGTWCRSDRAGTAKMVDKRDGDMRHTHCTHLDPCVCAMSVCHAKKMCQRKCACDTECVYTSPVAHTVVATTCVRTPERKKKPQTSSVHVHLDLSHQDLFHQFAFHKLSHVRVKCFSVSRGLLFF